VSLIIWTSTADCHAFCLRAIIRFSPCWLPSRGVVLAQYDPGGPGRRSW